MLGLIGKKIGMTQLFADDGTAVPVTAIEAGPCPIIQVKTEERDGYRAVQLGFGSRKPKRSRKPGLGHSEKAGLDYVPAIIREFRLGEADELADDPHSPSPVTEPTPELEEGEAAEGEATVEGEAGAVEQGLRVGQVLTVEIFSEGERVKVTGRTKGRGFQGVVKRHGFRGFPKTHGHPSVRLPGSIGPGTDPSRVIKGRKMAGQMGTERNTIRNLQVVKIDPERNLLFVKGAVPGARNGWLFIGKQ
ncbi:MAG: 50S ribosomal protein L3 [Gemmatimonadetes bacterium]|nr:50S ribosomal protein L3 [Gemmatimonadota bacterium]NIO30321.1 50S ribosomal protein L3 [Gemmatimonadota bacterium]